MTNGFTDPTDLDALFGATYEELPRLAAVVKRSHKSATLNPTALVHEAWIKLSGSTGINAASELHFVAKMAGEIEPNPDWETNYLPATHLAYVGETDGTMAMLKRTVEEGYCSYPAMDSDPALANLRSKSKFTELRAAGVQCQKNFLMDAATGLPDEAESRYDMRSGSRPSTPAWIGCESEQGRCFL
jgi:hypothetical protein